jgi:hypothetical protein
MLKIALKRFLHDGDQANSNINLWINRLESQVKLELGSGSNISALTICENSRMNSSNSSVSYRSAESPLRPLRCFSLALWTSKNSYMTFWVR